MLNTILTILVSACTIIGAVNGVFSAVLLCVPKTSKAYPVIATVASDIKSIWAIVAKLASRPGPDDAAIVAALPQPVLKDGASK